ncbi:hypothetical protein GCM10010441_36570 [Kitasatospora paracochleata]|uniref:Uncharacterized protein n=1 Tax=Kitasatospora paracochleata TaxID=58354 RepID=A0ABT1JAC2_9ACTN|nr:hypothetical protein [Kitasatospora paracochleata]MCP2314406.1 hypothetical protein [Kitasatospora paracochleata]
MSPRGTAFSETMLGTVHLAEESQARPVRLDLRVRADRLVLPHRTTHARLVGRVRIWGLADDARATGELEISPVARRRIRYRLEFDVHGRRHTLLGWKSITPGRPLRSMTRLPYTLTDEDGRDLGHGVLRFPLATGLVPFLAGWRFPRQSRRDDDGSRWDGAAGRTEVWYTTLTDPSDGTGVWLHHELVAPTDGSPPRVHGWVALFPPAGPVEHARYGPLPWPADPPHSTPVDPSVPGERRLRGTAGPYSWDLTERPTGKPLYTFPRWAWRHGVLPAAQMLPAATSRYAGTLTGPGGVLHLDGAPGASARIYGHGNARRWAWLHADLGGGDVLEVVAAVSTRPLLRRLPPLVFLRLRRGGRTWPRRALRPAVGLLGLDRFRAELGLPTWSVTGRAGLRRLRVTVHQPEARTLAMEYTDPDGSRAVCRNSEAADAEVVLERWWGRWRDEARWVLDGTAHAEVGDR